MTKNRSAKQRLTAAVLALVMMVTSLLGTTFAWFTDEVTSAGNKIESGTLKIDLLHKKGDDWVSLKTEPAHKIFDYDKWEPGFTTVETLKIANLGSLSLQYKLSVERADGSAQLGKNGEDLASVIDVYVAYGETTEADYAAITESDKWAHKGTLAEAMKNPADFIGGQLLPTGKMPEGTAAVGSQIVKIALHMQESAGNEYQKLGVGDIYVNLVAAQWSYENDSFGKDYDKNATFPDMEDVDIAIDVTTANGMTTAEVTVTKDGMTVTVPADTKVDSNKLGLSVKKKNTSDTNLTMGDNEIMLPLDVHVEGLAEDNDKPVVINLGGRMPKGLNIGNYTLYHVENGTNVAMTAVSAASELDAHNEFYYDPATGEVTVAMATFSEVALVANTVNAWNGERDYTWYDASKTDLTIANGDQLAAFGAIVGGMDGQTQDSFKNKTVKLLADINLGDKESENNESLIFYPIGYYNSTGSYEKVSGGSVSSYYNKFEGTFDGNGNTISNFYQNTWEMFGDYNDGYSGTPNHSRDGMGLFGNVYGGTVKNLTVENFSSDGEFATTGVIAAYADSGNGKSATFENIAILNCNPRVYNIGNGGIVGCAGWYSRSDETAKGNPVTFKNITVDQSNTISALWGSYDVSCGGILGQYYPDSACGVSFENCHVAAIMDVNNDVCANYQYYWYRYSGMLIGTIRANTKDDAGYTVADPTGIVVNGCTYSYGSWNEYWYCELVKNSSASYTHDYQFGRLTNIDDLSEIKSGETWLKEGNFALVSDDRKSVECYHIFKNSEGNLYRHFHDVADESNPNIYEDFDLNGDGLLNDLKEDRQRYYLPFGQVFNGLGYGVKPTYTFEGFTLIEDGTVISGEKFNVKDGADLTYRPGDKIYLKDLVGLSVDSSKMSQSSLYVAASPVGDGNVANIAYSRDVENWENNYFVISEDSIGAIKIVITDYFYCTPTVIYLNPEQAAEKFTANTVSTQNAYTQITLGALFGVKNGTAIGNVTATVTDPNGNETTVTGTSADWATKTIDLTKDGTWTVVIKDDDAYCAVTETTFTVNKVDKFANKFTGDFLYRVGNANTVAWGSLFSDLSSEIASQNLNITVENVAGNAGGTFSNGEIQFTGTGVVKVTISADGAKDLTLNLEVVEAWNATAAQSTVEKDNNGNITFANNVVLLNDCGFGSLEVSNGYTLYGNGFTMTCGSDSAALDIGYAFVTLENGTLDNVQIVCPNFDYAVLYPSNAKDSGNRKETTDKTRYFNVKSAVMTSGNSIILNSRISGGRAAVYATNGNLVIDNSQIEFGAAANIHAGAALGGLTLKNVTLIQKPTQATVGDTSKTLMGVSVIVMANSAGESTPITIEGNLDQYAWAHEGYSGYVPEKGKNLISTVMDQDNYIHSVKYGDGTYDSVNLGIIFMPEDTVAVKQPTVNDNRVNAPYSFVSISNASWIYTVGNSNIVNNLNVDTDMTNIPKYMPTAQGDTLPLVEYNDTNENRVLSSIYSTDKGWIYKLSVNLDNGAYTFDFANLVITKAGVAYAYTLPSGVSNTIQVEEGTTEYVLTAIIDGVEHEIYFQLIGAATSKEAPKWSNDANGTNLSTSMNATWADGVCVSTGNNKTWGGAAPALSNVYVRYYSTAEKAYKVINLAEYTPTKTGTFDGTDTTCTITGSDFTLTLTGGQVHSSNKVNAMPVVIQNGSTYTLYFVASASNGLVNPKNDPRSIPVSYTFTDGLGNTLTGSHTWSVAEKNEGAYNYDEFCKGTLKTNECITPDTLITLADGTQVRVDSLTGNEELLVWNMETGKLDTAPILFVDSETEAEYEIVKLIFSDGTEVKVIGEHGFWDYDLNKYVYLDRYAEKYLGHTFAKQNGDKLERIELVDVVIETELTTAWSPVTAGHLCYFVNGMLSMPGGIGGLFNIFEVDPETMTYDLEAMQKDIETYGLYTYEELNAICPLSEEMFNAAGGAYLKISIGKGNLTENELIYMINRYSKFFA